MFGIGVAELTIILLFGTPLVAVLGGIVIVVLIILKGKSTKALTGEEAKIMQAQYQGLRRLEERVDALETILLDKQKQRESSTENTRESK